MYHYFIFWLIFHCVVIPHFVYLFISWEAFNYIQLGSFEWCCYEHWYIFVWAYVFILDIYLGVELLSQMVTQYLAFLKTDRLLSKVSELFYSLIWGKWWFWFLHILVYTIIIFFIISILVVIKWNLTVVWFVLLWW